MLADRHLKALADILVELAVREIKKAQRIPPAEPQYPYSSKAEGHDADPNPV